MEEWRTIIGYDGLYEVSNYGNVRSVQRKVKTKGGAIRNSPGRLLMQKVARNGYKQVHLMKENVGRWYLVHRLVAIAFVPNQANLPQVNHKDENKQNNRCDNLEWVTASHNCRYGHRNDKMVAERSKKVECIIGNDVKTYNSIREAARLTGISASHICQCCKGLRRTAGNRRWMYAIELAEQ